MVARIQDVDGCSWMQGGEKGLRRVTMQKAYVVVELTGVEPDVDI